MDVPLSQIAQATVDPSGTGDERVGNSGRQDVVIWSRSRGWNLESVGDPLLGVCLNTNQDAARLAGMRSACGSQNAMLCQLGD